MTVLPFIDVFDPGYEIWSKKEATSEEIAANGWVCEINDSLPERIDAPLVAAKYIAKVQADNGLANHIKNALRRHSAYREWRKLMPSRTPVELAKYQKTYSGNDSCAADLIIKQLGSPLSDEQCLFHGGLWWCKSSNEIKTERPLSTSFCPQVALRNAEYKAKAYDAGRIDLFVLRASKSKTKAFAFKQWGTKMGYELEVLLSSDVSLKKCSETLVRLDYPASKYEQPSKVIPIYVLEIEFS
jgi:hypothetical protein